MNLVNNLHEAPPPLESATNAQICESIMIVDDNDSLREALVTALSNKGYSVTSARNGKEAIRLLALVPNPTLLFLDLMMPQMNGWDLLTRLNQDDQKIEKAKIYKVVFMSAVSPQLRPDQRPLPKSDGILKKPVSLPEVFGFVARFCKKPDARV